VADKDNWEHKASTMICKTCMWAVEKADGLLRCRMHAPTLKGWPTMFPTDWCGDHKLDGKKIEV
jgi:hypothetical protein